MSTADLRQPDPSTIVERILAWAGKEDAIRAVLLMGSRVRDVSVDTLADLDIGLFATDFSPFLNDDTWMSQIAPVWVCSPYQMFLQDIVVPTRLVIYEGGNKVDYSFWSPASVSQLADARYFDTGYRILLDKDGLLQALGEPSFQPAIPPKPTEHEFVRLINEYWFEAYHVAKYLKRDDLWLVKFRDFGSLKVYLLTLMEWYMLAKHGWNYDVQWDGKQIKQWLDPAVYARLQETFAHFDARDSWAKFIANNELFQELSARTAQILGYAYPADVATNLERYILGLRADH